MTFSESTVSLEERENGTQEVHQRYGNFHPNSRSAITFRKRESIPVLESTSGGRVR